MKLISKQYFKQIHTDIIKKYKGIPTVEKDNRNTNIYRK